MGSSTRRAAGFFTRVIASDYAPFKADNCYRIVRSSHGVRTFSCHEKIDRLGGSRRDLDGISRRSQRSNAIERATAAPDRQDHEYEVAKSDSPAPTAEIYSGPAQVVGIRDESD